MINFVISEYSNKLTLENYSNAMQKHPIKQNYLILTQNLHIN